MPTRRIFTALLVAIVVSQAMLWTAIALSLVVRIPPPYDWIPVGVALAVILTLSLTAAGWLLIEDLRARALRDAL